METWELERLHTAEQIVDLLNAERAEAWDLDTRLLILFNAARLLVQAEAEGSDAG